MGQGYLIDSNSVIEFFSKKLPQPAIQFIAGIEPNISIITYIEIFSSNRISTEELFDLESFAQDATIYHLNMDIVHRTIQVRRGKKIKTPDAIIAATALILDYTLITRNTADFKNIEGLKILNPYDI